MRGRCGRHDGAGIQAGADLHDGPAALRVAVQAVARDVLVDGRECIWHERILRDGTGWRGQMLRESFDQREA
jgi:hypothetical protein